MATWARATVAIECSGPDCGRVVPRGEPVYLVTVGNHPKCRQCARTTFQADPPADLPVLPEAVQAPVIGQGSQDWKRFDKSFASRSVRTAIQDYRAKAAGE